MKASEHKPSGLTGWARFKSWILAGSNCHKELIPAGYPKYTLNKNCVADNYQLYHETDADANSTFIGTFHTLAQAENFMKFVKHSSPEAALVLYSKYLSPKDFQ
jgi:hypothetical protein